MFILALQRSTHPNQTIKYYQTFYLKLGIRYGNCILYYFFGGFMSENECVSCGAESGEQSVDKVLPLTGGCVCGSVRYTASATPFAADYCHCDTCRRSSGAPVSAWMDFKTEQVTIEGQIDEFQSSENIYRGFCPKCGTRLTFRHVDYPQYTTLTVSSLDNPNSVSPTYHIYTEESVDWLDINDNLPRYERGQTS